MQRMVPAITVKAALKGFEGVGLNGGELLAQANLTAEALAEPFAAVPDEAFSAMWVAAFQRMPDPTLPTKSAFAVPFSEFGMVDHLVATADTVGEGLHMLRIYFRLVATELYVNFSHDDGDWVWVDSEPVTPTSHISEQWTLAIICKRFRNWLPNFDVEAVTLRQEDADNAERFAELWGVPVRLGHSRTGMQLAAGSWELRNHEANPLLHQTLRGVAEQVEVKQFEEAPLIYAIRTRLPDALEAGHFSAETIATELGLSKRTLQRRLSAENLTFKALLDDYRHGQAVLMLQSGERDMGQIAYALGYNEQSSFNRAFRRWTGQSPSAWLAQYSVT